MRPYKLACPYMCPNVSPDMCSYKQQDEADAEEELHLPSVYMRIISYHI